MPASADMAAQPRFVWRYQGCLVLVDMAEKWFKMCLQMAHEQTIMRYRVRILVRCIFRLDGCTAFKGTADE